MKSTSIVGGHFLHHTFENSSGDLSDSHSSQIVDDVPTLHLSRQEHVLDDLFVHKNSCLEGSFKIFQVDLFTVEN